MMLKHCRICKSNKIEKLYRLNNKFTIFFCSNCNTDLLYPLPSLEDIKSANDEFYFEAYGDPSIKEFKIVDLKRVLDELSKGKIGSALEVGCAFGYLVEYLLSANINAFGIELSDDVAKKAQKKLNGRIIQGDFEKYSFRQRFDIIIMFDFLEHVFNPLNTINKARQILSKKGFILIITPDIDAVKRKLLRHNWTAYYVEHIHCFSRKSLSLLAKKTDLKLYKYKRFHKTINTFYFIRKLYQRFHFFSFLNFLTRFPLLNFNFRINDDSMLVILKHK